MVPYNEMPQPEEDIVLSNWGAGNYYIEDKTIGKTIRISPDLYWKIIDQVRILIAPAEENKE